MILFSERYNYRKVSDVIIREGITPEIQNAICSCYDKLEGYFINSGVYQNSPILRAAFEKLYAYTNQPETGIRHALMDDNGTYTPASEEALFMLVSCCSFINYLNKKMG